MLMEDALITDQEIAILCDILEGRGKKFNPDALQAVRAHVTIRGGTVNTLDSPAVRRRFRFCCGAMAWRA